MFQARTIGLMSDVVTVRGLRKAYGTRVVVDGLDLDVPAGEIVGLIGANGAGKTTTVECIQGLRRPDGGRLRVLGYDPATQAERLRPLLGSQLQDSALPDRLRVAEAISLFAVPGARDGGELLERFGLAGRRRSAFSSLSGGERQRLFLVLALLNRPRLVILDELTQGLDPAARRDVWAAVRQLQAFIGQGMTNGEIAARLVVSEGTVKTHVNHLFTKLQLRDRAAAVVFAFDHDLVRPARLPQGSRRVRSFGGRPAPLPFGKQN